MIDLKKPLEGGPGLLLMGLLILFGAVLGVIGMIAWSKWKLEPDMANFLGGVMGAALGAGLAIMGALYVQQRDSWDRARKPAHIISQNLYWLGRWVGLTLLFWEGIAASGPDHRDDTVRGLLKHLDGLEGYLEKLPDGEELPWEIHVEVLHAKELVRWFVGTWRAQFNTAHIPTKLPENCWKVQSAASAAIQKLKRHFPKFSPAIEIDF